MKLQTQMVEKPWGRGDIAAAFAAPAGKRIGEIWFDAGGAPLPLLIKWLFTSDKLSVQVHPNDAQARARRTVGQGRMLVYCRCKAGRMPGDWR